MDYEEFEQLLNTGQIPYHRLVLPKGKSRTVIDESVIEAIVSRMAAAAVTEAAEKRLGELRSHRAMMTVSVTRPTDKQVRQRTGADDHLELGTPKKPWRPGSSLSKAPDAIPEGPAPKVPESAMPGPCANESCGQLFRKPSWAFRVPNPKERFCSRRCATEQAGREYRRRPGDRDPDWQGLADQYADCKSCSVTFPLSFAYCPNCSARATI